MTTTRTKANLLINGLVFATLATAMAVSAATPGTSLGIGDNDRITETRPVAPGSPAALLADHDCWTGAQPQGKTARSVVVRATDGNAVWTARADVLDRAIGQEVFGQDHGLDVFGFCADTAKGGARA